MVLIDVELAIVISDVYCKLNWDPRHDIEDLES